ncbi:MAG: hypothetical protein R2911_04080 [Caldilineaceae bacterium]
MPQLDLRQETIDGIVRRIADLNEQSLAQLSQYISFLKWQEELWHSLLDDEDVLTAEERPAPLAVRLFRGLSQRPHNFDAHAGHDGDQSGAGHLWHGAADGAVGTSTGERQRSL